jgi:hypothetical protein
MENKHAKLEEVEQHNDNDNIHRFQRQQQPVLVFKLIARSNGWMRVFAHTNCAQARALLSVAVSSSNVKKGRKKVSATKKTFFSSTHQIYL